MNFDKIISDYRKKERAELLKEYEEKLELLRNIDLVTEATADDTINVLLDQLSAEEREEVDGQTAEIADGYSTMLRVFANSFEDLETAQKIIDELKRRAG